MIVFADQAQNDDMKVLYEIAHHCAVQMPLFKAAMEKPLGFSVIKKAMEVTQVWHEDASSASVALELKQLIGEMGTMEVSDKIEDLASLPATISKLQFLIASIPPNQQSQHAELLAKGTHRTIRAQEVNKK